MFRCQVVEMLRCQVVSLRTLTNATRAHETGRARLMRWKIKWRFLYGGLEKPVTFYFCSDFLATVLIAGSSSLPLYIRLNSLLPALK